MPALATSTSTGPCCGLDRGERRVDRRVVGDVAARPRTARPGASPDREVTATVSPASANARAIASPIPRLPPVTSTERGTRHPCRRSRPVGPSVAATLAATGGYAATGSGHRERRFRRVGCMRAIQITRFGGPEVLELVELPDPVPTGDLQVWSRSTPPASTTPTPTRPRTPTSPAQTLPMVPGAEVVGPYRGRPAGGRPVAAPAGTPSGPWRTPRRRYDRSRTASTDGAALAAARAGHHGLAPAADQRPPGAGRVGGRARRPPAASARLAVQLAQAWGAGRVIATASTRGQARPRPRARRRRRGRPDRGRACATGCARRTAARPVDVVLEMTGGPVFDASLAALAPFGPARRRSGWPRGRRRRRSSRAR